MYITYYLRVLFLGFALFGVQSSLFAIDSPKKDWRIEESLSTKFFYDTNIYNTDVGPFGNQKAFGVVVTPSFKALGKLYDIGLSFGYTPAFTAYSAYNEQNYVNQLFTAEEKFKAFDFNWELNQSLGWVSGLHSLPFYTTDAGVAYTPGLTGPNVQPRANQLNWSESFKVEKKWDKYLLEFVGNGTYTDFRTYHDNGATTGYINLTDRYDVNAGSNIGYKLYQDVYAVLGYRVGHQWQGINSSSSNEQYTNDYQRVVAGLRGDLFDKKLTFDFLCGPDFRHFSGNVYSNASVPAFTRYQTFLWYNGSATLNPTKTDAFSVILNRRIQMASSGAGVYEASTGTAKYVRKLPGYLSVEGGLSFENRHYLQGTATLIQNYTLYSPFVGLNYQPKGNLSYRLGYAYNSVQADNPKPAGSVVAPQEFSQSIISFEANYKF
jgi:hypothetical protein